MATAVADTYSAPSGATLYAGRPFDPGNVYLAIWGQSNAQGAALRSDISTSPLSSDSGLATYDAGTFSRVWIWTGSAFAQLQPSVNNGASAGYFGPEFGLAVRWMRGTSSGNLFLQKEAVSGAPISTFDTSVWPGSDMVSRAVDLAFPWLVTNGYTIAARHWLWVQGESNASDTQSAYQVPLQAIVDSLLVEGVTNSSSRYVLAQLKPGSATYGQGVFDAKAAIAAADSTHVKTVQMDYYGGDNIHCNARGQVQLGYDAFEQAFGTAHIAT